MDKQDSNLINDTLQNCDYLTYVIKETLRYDPLAFTLFYVPKEKVQICGIQLEKDTRLALNMFFPHYSPKEWQEPLRYIPERFDPSSSYFFKPETSNTIRDPLSYVPFSLGERTCPGQILAKLESKIVLTRFLARVKYEVDPSLLQNDYCRFNTFSQAKLKITIV